MVAVKDVVMEPTLKTLSDDLVCPFQWPWESLPPICGCEVSSSVCVSSARAQSCASPCARVHECRSQHLLCEDFVRLAANLCFLCLWYVP